MRGRQAVIGVVLIGLLGACDHETSNRRREPASDYLLRPAEAPDPVPPGVEMWVDEHGMDFEVDGERQRALEFCPGCSSMRSPGVEPVHELTFAEKKSNSTTTQCSSSTSIPRRPPPICITPCITPAAGIASRSWSRPRPARESCMRV